MRGDITTCSLSRTSKTQSQDEAHTCFVLLIYFPYFKKKKKKNCKTVAFKTMEFADFNVVSFLNKALKAKVTVYAFQ